jgi:CRP/FNR family transcriptional regulator
MNELHNCTDCKIGARCFQKLVSSELEFINKNKTQISYRKGENLCKQGAYASYVIYVASGLVKLYIENSNDKFTNFKIIKAGEFIGLASVFGENIYNYSAIALKDCEVCLIEKEGVKELIKNNSNFAIDIIKGYSKDEKTLINRLKSVSYKQMHGRIADAILYLSSEKLIDENVYHYITRKDLADFACISKESTIKILTEFKNDNIIELDGKDIEIINLEKLKNISLHG